MSESLKGKQTVLEEGTEFEGSIRSQCAITVSGNLKGDVSAPALTITPSGSVQGHVKVTELRSEGEIAGEIDAESVELSGHVSDQTTIRATSLQVRLGQDGTTGKLQVTFGSCDLHVGDPVVKSQSGPTRKEKREQPRVVSTVVEPTPELEVK
jgi:cytoskeletal protein CcmA (bactofilin family)